jgi:DNA-binding NarL/FixJ family response regulator
MQTKDVPQINTHEQLIEMMSMLLLEVNSLQTLLAEERPEAPADRQSLRNGLHNVEQHARIILQRMRVSDEELSPLNGGSLAEALSNLLEESAERLGLGSRIALSGVDEQSRPDTHTLLPSTERLLFFIAREALEQVPTHTGAHRLRLSLNYGQDEVQMSIEDDGLNLSLLPAYSELLEEEPLALPFAMTNSSDSTPASPELDTIWRELRLRIEHLGGSLTISALQERGTRVQAHVPYLAHIHAGPTSSQPSVSQEGNVSILVVDRQAVIRAALNQLLESYPGLHVIGQAADGVQAVSETLELGPQVVLLDSQLPEGQSLEALRQIKQLNLNTRVLLFSTQERDEYLYELLRAGADGYILKDIAPDALAEAVRGVARGEIIIQPEIANRLLSRVGRGRTSESLTAREHEVLRLLARGLRNKEIAARLFVSERTVNFHLANIYQKLNVSGRTEALSKAIEQGLV